MIETIQHKRVIVAPLFWGLGHATRCIPIIDQLIAQGNTVAFASDGEALDLLCKEYPQLEYFELPGYDITYKSNSMLINMLSQSPKILKSIWQERKTANKIATQWHSDIIISDNRLGFKSDKTQNIYMTHQVSIPSKNQFLSAIANMAHRRYINQFDQCLIPDSKGENSLSGKMTEGKLNIPKHYIGALSRLLTESREIKYDYTAILSGPEPKRTTMEKTIIQVFSERKDLKCCLVRGTATPRKTLSEGIDTFDLLDTKTLNIIINESSKIICRAGYTSIMDLVKLEKQAILIPTPGQYEQEYLAEYLNDKHGFKTTTIDKLAKAI